MGLDRLGDALKDVWDFERSHLKSMADRIKDDPKRLLSPVPMVDPIGTKIGTTLGFGDKDTKPLVNQWGGATEESYQEAEARGIDTRAGRAMHDVAQTVAASYAGGYGMEQGATALGNIPGLDKIPSFGDIPGMENIPEGVQRFLPTGGSGGGGSPFMSPADARLYGQVMGGGMMAGQLIDEREERNDPGIRALPTGPAVGEAGTSPHQKRFEAMYGGGRQPATRHQPGKGPAFDGAPSGAIAGADVLPKLPEGWVTPVQEKNLRNRVRVRRKLRGWA